MQMFMILNTKRIRTHTRAHVSFTQSCYFRSDWDDNAVDSILFNLTFSANIHLICSYLQHLAMVCCPFSWLFIRGIFFPCWIISKFFHIQSAFFQFFTFDWSKHNSTNLFWLKIEKVVCFFLKLAQSHVESLMFIERSIRFDELFVIDYLMRGRVRSTKNWHFQLNPMLK